MVSLVELIARKRDGGELAPEEIHRVIHAFMAGEMADYQMSSLLMAVFQRGMSDAETVALTEAMLRSGKVIDLSHIPGIKVDKHSTGGVGDKVSLSLVPIVAACGVPVPMVSGRGLGHTGGTLDKLEAIPGFRVDLDVDRFAATVRDLGGCMIGQTAEIAPADKRIYALRDVTATVESVPLIVASILSKKLAEGIDALVLDVKVGKGAFMKDIDRARTLAHALVRVGTRAGKRVVALLTRMEEPLGRTVGNALETREAIDLLFGRAPADLVECTEALAVEMILLGGKAESRERALAMVRDSIRTGSAARKMEKLIEAHGGDPRVVQSTDLLPKAPLVETVKAKASGWVSAIDALEIGLCAVALGAGRTRADQAVDPAVGIVIGAAHGSRVEAGDTLAELHVRSGQQADAVRDRVAKAFRLESAAPAPKSLVLERIES
ncbi:MAG: thymidine phosphorylase [Deltaproteobacteria bacterium]|nr:thymidine phosphorylase [Deltaproteobacteria bacterium]